LEDNGSTAGGAVANAAPPVAGAVERSPVGGLLSRRQVLKRASALGLGGLVLSALPVAEQFLTPAPALADPTLLDGTLQAVADTLIPGRKATRTDLSNEIHPKAIAGVDPEPGAVQADALLVFHDPRIGFDSLQPAFQSELESRSLLRGGQFLDLPFPSRVSVLVDGLSASNPTVLVWEAAAAVAFAAFLIAATQINATIDTASGLQVMGHPGTAPNGYADYSYGKKLSRELTAGGSLP
jgi:hypothetical protein